MNENQEIDVNDPEEWARLIYRNQIDSIEAVKRRQWAITNYILLIFVAIIGYINLSCMDDVNMAVAFFLLILSLVISIIGNYHLIDMHLAITKYRKKLSNIAAIYQFVKKIDSVSDDDPDFFKYFWWITSVFIFLVLVGLTLVVIFIYNSAEKNFPGFPLGYCLIVFLFGNIILSMIFTYRANEEANNFDSNLDELRQNISNYLHNKSLKHDA